MPTKKGLKPYAKRTELTKDVRPRLEILEAVLMNAAPKWNGKKFTTSMTIKEACEKEGITDLTLRNWRQDNPKLGQYWISVMESRKQMLHDMLSQAALQNVMEVIGGGIKVRPMDKANLSMRYLEKTDSDMNPGLKVNIDSKTLNISMGSEEMEQRVMEIASALNIHNLKEYANNTTTISTNTTQEPSGDGETTRFEGSSIIEYTSTSEGVEES